MSIVLLWLLGCSFLTNDPVPEPPPASGDAPNILVLMWDTVRADRMSLYGHERPTTPRLDEFAKGARVYERAISPGMWTVPSHASLFTGLPVASHGANARWIWLDGRFTTAAEHFGQLGWDTWAWSSNPYLSDASNLLQGFDHIECSWKGGFASEAGAVTQAKLIPEDRSCELSPSWDPKGSGKGWPKHLTAYKDGGQVARDALVDWLEHREQGGPWLAYINYLEAHHPRIPTLEARQAVLTPELVRAGLETEAGLQRTMGYMEGRESFTEAELEAIRGVYDASLHDLDRVTGSLLDALAERGELQNTIVVLVSDHGEHLGEHGMFDHRWSVQQELLGVPLVVHFPPRISPGRVDAPVSTQQVFPTLCDLAGVQCPPLPVSSLMKPPPAQVFAELIQPTPRLPQVRQAYPNLDPERWRLRYHVMVDGSDKLIRRSDKRKSLFDLDADPNESVDLAAERPERVREMLETVRAWQQRLERYDPSQRAATDQPNNALQPDPDTLEQLRLLGYVAEEEAP